MTHYRPWEPLLPASWTVRGTLLVVAPHPDDEVLGCGGVVAAHRDAGAAVHVALVTDGGLGNVGAASNPTYVAERKAEARRAVESLGGAQHHFLDHADGSLKDNEAPIDDIAALVKQVAPATVLIPSPYEVHPDHRAACLLAARALQSVGYAGELLSYEVGAMMPANLLIDVTAYMDRIEAALRAFPSQLLHQDLIGKCQAHHHARTVNVGDPAIRYAEAYVRVEMSRLSDWLRSVEETLELTDGMRPTP